MIFKTLFLLGLFFMKTTASSEEKVTIQESLRHFLGTVERYKTGMNDVVFLLDESGSIGADKFIEVKKFTELMARQFSVSADETRVAVVTFANDNKKHVNYIADHKGNNMCTLLQKIEDIPYRTGGTRTSLAMEEAERILDRARPNARKIIVLLTDGQSNDGYSPIEVSIRVKNKGFIVFAIGVAGVNQEEIDAVATNKNHTYILTEFKHIVDVNNYLIGDVTDTSLDLTEDDSPCKAPCDVHAKCYCGSSSGKYECKCDAGYYGQNGFIGQCHKCPRGTYKPKAENINCLQCPEHSTTFKEGSTDLNDCKCDSGYERIGKICSPLKCAALSAPEGGILIPRYCNNTYGTMCQFKCNKGYCPISCKDNPPHPLDNNIILPKRTCLETRKWSNDEFYCEKMSCPALSIPQNGMHNCSDKDFTYGTTCTFKCDDGYELSGSASRTCAFNGWTGKDVQCKEIHCDKLQTNDVLKVRPVECGTSSSPYRSICTHFCVKGYVLLDKGNRTDGIHRCKSNRAWSGPSKHIGCKDIEPPKIKCPESIKVNTIPDKDHAMVGWDWPNATDNLYLADVRIIKPDWLQQRKIPAAFPIHDTKVVYEAIDIEKNTKTCSFTVTVLDKEPPKVLKCPKDIELYHDENNGIPVTWEGPIFEDNSKENLTISRNRDSGKLFAWGPPNIVNITASDRSNNTASCIFTVQIKPYPCPYYDPPANGAVTCDNWQSGRVCSIFCHDGFDFATSRKDFGGLLLCNPYTENGKKVGKWQNFNTKEIVLHEPWPDCSRKQKPDNVDAWIGMGFAVDTCTDEMIQKMREKFFNSIKKVPFFCRRKNGCAPKNVNVTCSPIIARMKRSFSYSSRINYGDTANKYNRLPRQTSRQMLTVSFNVEMLLNETDQSIDEKASNAPKNEDKIDLSSNPTIKELKDTISLDVKDVYNLKTVPKPELDIGVVAICSTGQVNVNNSCVNCPDGTYKDDVSGNCISCRTATFQDEERQMSCKPCPVGYTTYQVKSKSIDDCKAPCQPGTYSETAFAPCFACPLNTYQARTSGTECKKCPPGSYTWKVGANSSNDCVAPCKAGSFSDTGYKPCTLCDINSYQDQEMQKECMLCPNRTGTTHKGSKGIEDCKDIDICNSLRPCKHGSTCNQLDKEYECICPVGLRGKHCEINPDDCDPNPCLNNGTCVDGIGNFTCICPKGLGGHQCEINYDDCQPNPCSNGAECIDKINAYECRCAAGFYGEKCEKNMYECNPNPCLNNGTCFDMANDYRCCCSKDYTGKNCELQVNTTACDTVTCENGGSCVVDNESFNCICPYGFEGDVCEINVDDCKEIHCENGGTCIDGIGNATCQCPSKFVGQHCEEKLIPEFLLNFPAPDTTNYAKAVNNHSLHEITVALFMRTSLKDPNIRSTPLSYSYTYHTNLQDNGLTLYDTNNLKLYIHGEQFFTEYTANSDALWHHYAITWEKKIGQWHFYVDGNVIMSGTAGKDKYMHPGIFILGQEQDGLGDRFNSLEAFAGDITEFNVWDYVLTTEEIKRISSGCGYVGNVIPWYTVSQSVFGNVALSQDVDKCKALGSCQKNSCDCFYADSIEGYSCKYIVEDCIDENTCSYGQPCESNGNFSYCNCRDGFEGRRCEYDIDECLENNGGCKYVCLNDVGTGSYHCECPEEMVLSEDGKNCKETNYCLRDDKIYMDGEDWISSCQNCSCDHGSVTCKDIVCNVAECLPEETLVTSPGECCPKCVAWSFCLISLNNTILTFDLSSYEIEGICTYTALEDCFGGRFKVQIESSEVAPGQETNIVIYQDCYKVIISSNGRVTVDNMVVNSTFQNEALTLEYANSSFTLKTSSDMLVQWNFVDEIMISVPITDMHKMCGVCSKIEEYYLPGKFPLTERFAIGENECFLVSEDYDEIQIETSGSLNICRSNFMFTMLLLTITLFLFFRNRNFIECD